MRNSPTHGSSSGGHYRHFDTILSPLVKTGTGASSRSYAFFSLFLFLLLGAFLYTRLLLDPSVRPPINLLILYSCVIITCYMFNQIKTTLHSVVLSLGVICWDDILLPRGIWYWWRQTHWRLICRVTITFCRISHGEFDTCLHGTLIIT